MERWERVETRAWSQPPFWREILFLGGYLEAVQRNLPCHTFKFLSLQWHSDRSLPVWCRGRESFRPPLPVADAERRAGHLPSRRLAPRAAPAARGAHSPQPGQHWKQAAHTGWVPGHRAPIHGTGTPCLNPQVSCFLNLFILIPHMVISFLHTPPIIMKNNRVNAHIH